MSDQIVDLDEQQFKRQFVATFLATWVANNYTEACMMGQHEKLRHPPVEDADDLAHDAWRQWKKIMID